MIEILYELTNIEIDRMRAIKLRVILTILSILVGFILQIKIMRKQHVIVPSFMNQLKHESRPRVVFF